MSLNPITFLMAALGGVAALFSGVWVHDLRGRRKREAVEGQGLARPRAPELLTGAVTMFFDTLGIGSFAPSTALLRFQKLLPDYLIPGTLNAGHSLASILQAFIYIAILPVEGRTLILTVGAATLGAWLGAGVVATWPRKRIQGGMGAALLVAALLMLLGLLKWMPSGGDALGLTGAMLVLAVLGHLVMGALMTLGIGLFAPSMMLLSFLGVSPKAIFPIMMTACAFVMPVGGLRFIRAGSYAPRVALGLTIGGIPAVLLAAFLVKELPLLALRWVVLGVVVYTGTMLVRAAGQPEESSQA